MPTLDEIPRQQNSRPTPQPRARRWAAVLLLCVAGLIAYANSLAVPFIFDDIHDVLHNPAVRTLAPDAHTASPASGPAALVGRPVAELSFTLNHFLSLLGGETVWGFHAVNIAIHIAAALLLMGIVRRTLRLPRTDKELAGHADTLALAVALLWLLHPMQTSAVTYILQRTESLMAFFYLLTLYAALRGFITTRPTGWYLLAVVACLLGMGTKEVMVSAPLAVLLYDRLFVAGTFAHALRRRWPLYLGLVATWGFLAWCVSLGGRAGDAGFAFADLTWADYLRTQFGVVLHYIRLAFWPAPLVFDYGSADHGVAIVRSLGWWVLYAAIVGMMLLVTAVLYWRRSWLGFAGACFFMVLAVTSSVVPIHAQVIAEHRMYLPLAALAAAVVIIGRVVLDRLGVAGRTQAIIVAVLALTLGGLTIKRNHDYRTAEAIWQDVIDKRPANPRGYAGLGKVMVETDNLKETLEQREKRWARTRELLDKAIALDADYADAHNAMGGLLMKQGRTDLARKSFERAVELAPEHGGYRGNLGLASLALRDPYAAIDHLRAALDLGAAPGLRWNLGTTLLSLGQVEEAIVELEKGSREQPDSPLFLAPLGTAYARLGRFDEAAIRFEKLLEIQPDADAHAMMAGVLIEQGSLDEGERHLREALKQDPNHQLSHLFQQMLKQKRNAPPPPAAVEP